MEAGEHEERGAEQVRAQRQAVVRDEGRELVELAAQEHAAQERGRRSARCASALLATLDSRQRQHHGQAASSSTKALTEVYGTSNDVAAGTARSMLRSCRPGRSRSACRRTCSPRPGRPTSAACGCRPVLVCGCSRAIGSTSSGGGGGRACLGDDRLDLRCVTSGVAARTTSRRCRRSVDQADPTGMQRQESVSSRPLAMTNRPSATMNGKYDGDGHVDAPLAGRAARLGAAAWATQRGVRRSAASGRRRLDRVEVRPLRVLRRPPGVARVHDRDLARSCRAAAATGSTTPACAPSHGSSPAISPWRRLHEDVDHEQQDREAEAEGADRGDLVQLVTPRSGP